jgi:hypothetical protein
MAERRMFAKAIIDSDKFLDMPLSTQALYFHLSMRADDEGFISNPKKIMRMIGADEDSMKLLIAKQFIIPFESGIVVIKHWRIHNYIQADRFKKSLCTEEREQIGCNENKEYVKMDTECIHGVSTLDTQVRLGKDRLGKDRLGKDRLGDSKGETDVSPPPTKTKRFIKPSLDEVRSYCQERQNNVDAERFIDYYESNGWKVGKNPMKDWKAAVRTWERRSYNEPIQQPAPNIADIPDEELSEMDRIYKKLRC